MVVGSWRRLCWLWAIWGKIKLNEISRKSKTCHHHEGGALPFPSSLYHCALYLFSALLSLFFFFFSASVSFTFCSPIPYVCCVRKREEKQKRNKMGFRSELKPLPERCRFGEHISLFLQSPRLRARVFFFFFFFFSIRIACGRSRRDAFGGRSDE